MSSAPTPRPFTPSPAALDGSLLTIRLVFGLGMAIWHGWAKLPVEESFVHVIEDMGMPAPRMLAWAAVLCEFIGGICIVLGFFTRTASLGVLLCMLVAVFIRYVDCPLKYREPALMYSGACLALMVCGPGRLSVDYVIARRRSRQPAA